MNRRQIKGSGAPMRLNFLGGKPNPSDFRGYSSSFSGGRRRVNKAVLSVNRKFLLIHSGLGQNACFMQESGDQRGERFTMGGDKADRMFGIGLDE